MRAWDATLSSARFLSRLLEHMGTVFGAPLAKGLVTVAGEEARGS